MKINLYTIYDLKAGVYNKPFYMHNDSVVIRAMEDLINDPQNDIGRHPEDFIVWMLGTFDDNEAKFDLLENPVQIGKCSEIKSAMMAKSVRQSLAEMQNEETEQ